MLYEKLSDLTPAVVDSLYNIDRATPVAEPTFLFLIGVPGSGKSSMYDRFDNHAIINIDTLLESLFPFRAASSMSHYMQQQQQAKADVTFTSIGAYSSRKENMGMFKWYDKAPHGFHRVRERFQPLSGHEASLSLNDITSHALARAITKHINIVYETTLASSSKKVDDIMYFIKKNKAPYRVHLTYVRASAANAAARIRARQEYGMPQEEYPFYRYVPESEEFARTQIEQTERALTALRKKYKHAIRFEVAENPLVAERLPAINRRSASTRRRHILRAYGPGSGSPSDRLVFSLSPNTSSSNRPSLYVSSPSSVQRRRRLTVRNK